MGGGLLSKAAILAAEDLPYREVDVPEWGGTVRLRTMSGTERDAWEASMVQQNGKVRKVNTANIRAKLLALALVDEEGARLFDDADIRLLGAKSAKVMDRLFDVARELNGLSEDDVEELAEGFGDAQSDASTSA